MTLDQHLDEIANNVALGSADYAARGDLLAARVMGDALAAIRALRARLKTMEAPTGGDIDADIPPG